MAVTPVPMYRGNLPTSNTTLAAVPSGATWVITNIVLANTSSSTVQVTISLDGVAVLGGVTIPANTVAPFDIRQVLAATKTISGFATGPLGCHISGSQVA